MQKNGTCEWFVEPIGSHTNEWISKYLAEHQQVDNAHTLGLTDGKGTAHDVIAMPSYDAVRPIIASKANCEFKFNIFIRTRGHKYISRWLLYRYGKPKKIQLAHQT